ncbi:hypothetical protein KGP36_02350 [Patescibacteria group bacterium]|nr:hypothetical protein [Patescibacteria group bacterium]
MTKDSKEREVLSPFFGFDEAKRRRIVERVEAVLREEGMHLPDDAQVAKQNEAVKAAEGKAATQAAASQYDQMVLYIVGFGKDEDGDVSTHASLRVNASGKTVLDCCWAMVKDDSKLQIMLMSKLRAARMGDDEPSASRGWRLSALFGR